MICADGRVTIHVGDCRATMAALPEASVDCIVTSPPYYGLRSYDENAVAIDAALDGETRAWLESELVRRGIHAR